MSQKSQETYSTDCSVIQETDAAWLLNIDDDEHWIPKSQIKNNDELAVDTKVEVEMTEWIAIERGLV